MVIYKKPDVEQFLRAYTIQDFVLNNDESQLVFSTNISGKFNLWGMDLPNQFPYPLTFNDQNCKGLCYDKDGNFIIAAFDHNGDENSQLYMITPDGGQLNPVRTSEGHQYSLPILSDDGNRLYYTSNKDDSTYLKSYCYHIDTGDEETVISGDAAATYLVDVSPNEKSFVFLKFYSTTHIPAYVKLDEEVIPLTPESSEQHSVTDVIYTSESDIYFITNCDEDFSYIAKFNIEEKEFSKVVSLEGQDFKTIKYDKKQHLLYLVSESGVEDQLYSYDIDTAKLTELESPVGIINKVEVTRQGNVYLVGTSATNPSNIYRKKVNEQCWDKLTNNRILGMNEEQLVNPEVISYPSFDGLEIEALYYKANSSTSNGHVILWPHGGPQYAERKTFIGVFQYLLSEGYSIFTPNFRGSTGYGSAFTKMVEGDWGQGPRLDNIEGLEFLFRNGLADREKVFVMGGSFGGYMALLLHGRHPEYFKAIVDICGPSDLLSFIETVPDHWKPMVTQIVGDPNKDKDKLIEYSPITYLENMSKPMLVIQGANDPRVVKEESDQIVAVLTEKGRDIEYMVLEDEGHGLTKKENELKVYRAINEFFTKHL
ncbi:S9 family peptidase [Bacillus spongiae]|uniref:S9 family peptidase n=1 Tax=Bacillus spongiae TaxID=2683610 RepID=A0ABU8HC07_9BACI